MLLTQYLEHVGRRLNEYKLVVVFIDDWPLARWHAVIEKDEIFEYFHGLANRIMEMFDSPGDGGSTATEWSL